jgi:hypothetical protein
MRNTWLALAAIALVGVVLVVVDLNPGLVGVKHAAAKPHHAPAAAMHGQLPPTPPPMDDGTMANMTPGEMADLAGTSSTVNGAQLVLLTPKVKSGTSRVAFRIVQTGSTEPIMQYTLEQTKLLHLIIVSRDLSQYQHIHPTLAKDGTWSINAVFPHPGAYRMFADTTPTQAGRVVLGANITVTGKAPRSVPLPKAASVTTVDGYSVRMTLHGVSAGTDGDLLLTISKAGRPVTDLQPYLGALGHAVMIRSGTLEYLHTHPKPSVATGPTLDFALMVAHPGAYRGFFQFSVGGNVHTARFTITVPAAGAPQPAAASKGAHAKAHASKGGGSGGSMAGMKM